MPTTDHLWAFWDGQMTGGTLAAPYVYSLESGHALETAEFIPQYYSRVESSPDRSTFYGIKTIRFSGDVSSLKDFLSDDGTVVRTLSPDTGYSFIDLRVSADGDTIYILEGNYSWIAAGTTTRIKVVNVETWATTSTTTVRVAGSAAISNLSRPSMALSPDGARVYISFTSTNGATLYTYDTVTHTVSGPASTSFGNPALRIGVYGIEVSQDGGSLYGLVYREASGIITNRYLFEFDANTFAVLSTHELPYDSTNHRSYNSFANLRRQEDGELIYIAYNNLAVSGDAFSGFAVEVYDPAAGALGETIAVLAPKTSNQNITFGPPITDRPAAFAGDTGHRYTIVKEGTGLRVKYFERDSGTGQDKALLSNLRRPSVFQTGGRYHDDSIYIVASSRLDGSHIVLRSVNNGDSVTSMAVTPFTSAYTKVIACGMQEGGMAAVGLKKGTSPLEVWFSYSTNGTSWEPLVKVGDLGTSAGTQLTIVQEHAANSSRLVVTNGNDLHWYSDDYGQTSPWPELT